MKLLSGRKIVVSAVLTMLLSVFAYADTEAKTNDALSEKVATNISQSITPETLNKSWAIEWWLPRHKEKVALAQQGNVDLLLVGDSITHGWEQSGATVWQAFFGDINTLNIGFSGDRTENVLWRLQHGEVEGIKPKLTIMMIGTNNTGHRMDSPEDIASGVNAILDEFEQRIPDSKVLLLAIFPRGAKPDDEMRINNNAANMLLERLAKNRGVMFANINSLFLTDNQVLLPSVMPDLLHPKEDGYKIWAEALTPYIEKYVR